MDKARIEAYLRWTTRRFKDNSLELVWAKIQDNPRMKREYETVDQQPAKYAYSTANIEFALKNYGWQDLLRGLWIVATKKENSMHLMRMKKEQEKWIKVKDKLAQMPRNVQQ